MSISRSPIVVESPILPVKKKQFARQRIQRKSYIIKEKKRYVMQYRPGRPPAVSEQTRERNM